MTAVEDRYERGAARVPVETYTVTPEEQFGIGLMPAAPQFYSHPGSQQRTYTPPTRYLEVVFGVVGGNGIMDAWSNQSGGAGGRPVGDWLDRSTVASGSIAEVTGWLIPAKQGGSFATSKLPAPSLPDPRTLRADPTVLGMNGDNIRVRLAPKPNGHPNHVTSLPFGYKEKPFQRFAYTARDDFAEVGYDDATLFMQGSMVTGRRHSTGEMLDARNKILPGDYDIAVVSPQLVARAEDLGIDVFHGPLTSSDVAALGLTDVQTHLSATAKHRVPVNFKVFRSAEDVYESGPTIPFSDHDGGR